MLGYTMSEVIERMARAAYLAYSGLDPENDWYYGKNEGKPFDWRWYADLTSVEAEGFLRCAAAALAAIREPSKEMVLAGQLAGGISMHWGGVDAADMWRDMVDAALQYTDPSPKEKLSQP